MDLFTLTGIFLITTAIGIPVMYVCSWIFQSITLGIAIPMFVGFILFVRLNLKKIKLNWSAFWFLLFSLTFSTWLMFKTFHGGPSGEIFVGSNNVFDFGHALGIVRSFSWGSNIPFMSPFQSGLPFFYHFNFYFWVGILEYIGVPLVWAFNIPSILSFASLLIVIYYVPQIVAKQKPIVGWLAVALTISNSSLTFWKLTDWKNIWHLSNYPFAGPFDGSIISLFVTLNSYVNQRHLAFTIALGLFLYVAAITKRNSFWIGAVAGFMIFWNVAIYVVTGALITVWYLLTKQWKNLLIFVGTAVVVAAICFLPYIKDIFIVGNFLGVLTHARTVTTAQTWNIFDYLWQNLGILPIVSMLGFVVYLRPFIGLFITLCILAALGGQGFEQKSYAFLIIGMNILAAIGLVRMYTRSKLFTILIFIVITISGVVDLMPIKNEFAYPFIAKDMIPVMSWIRSSTPKSAIFVSYADIIDPVVLSGRKNYFGFFGNVGSSDRSSDVQRIYKGDIILAREKNISYVLVLKQEKIDVPYPIVYEDAQHRIYRVE